MSHIQYLLFRHFPITVDSNLNIILIKIGQKYFLRNPPNIKKIGLISKWKKSNKCVNSFFWQNDEWQNDFY